MPLLMSQDGQYEVVPRNQQLTTVATVPTNPHFRRRAAAQAVINASSKPTTKVIPMALQQTDKTPQEVSEKPGLHILPDPGIHLGAGEPAIVPREDTRSPANLAHVAEGSPTPAEALDKAVEAIAEPGVAIDELDRINQQAMAEKPEGVLYQGAGSGSPTTDMKLEDGGQRFAHLSAPKEGLEEPEQIQGVPNSTIKTLGNNMGGVFAWASRLMERMADKDPSFDNYARTVHNIVKITQVISMLNTYSAVRSIGPKAKFRFLTSQAFPEINVKARSEGRDDDSNFVDFLAELDAELGDAPPLLAWDTYIRNMLIWVNENRLLAEEMKVYRTATGYVVVELPDFDEYMK